jgi:hypothetical protein
MGVNQQVEHLDLTFWQPGQFNWTKFKKVDYTQPRNIVMSKDTKNSSFSSVKSKVYSTNSTMFLIVLDFPGWSENCSFLCDDYSVKMTTPSKRLLRFGIDLHSNVLKNVMYLAFLLLVLMLVASFWFFHSFYGFCRLFTNRIPNFQEFQSSNITNFKSARFSMNLSSKN